MVRAAFAESCAGRTLGFVIEGDAGVGKSRLVAEATGAMAERATVLVGSGIDIAEKPPFWPVTDALRRFLRQPGTGWATDILDPWAGRFPLSATGAPVPGDSVAPTPTDGAELPGVGMLAHVLAALAARKPLVLVVEDLQWADRSTRDLLVFVLATMIDEPVLLLVTCRGDALDRGHPLQRLLPELRRHRRVRFLDLPPLSRAATSELVAAHCGVRPDPSLDELVWDRSEGNPFVAVETLRAAAAGQLHAVPQTLRQMVLGRVGHCSGATLQVLGAVAVGQGPIDHQLLASVVDLPERQLLDALREAVDASILVVDREIQGYRFSHGLLADVVAAELLPGERRYLHRRYGEAIAGRGTLDDARTATLLAHHFDEAGDVQRALEATVAAAEHAERLHGRVEAFEHWTRALRLAPVAGDPGATPPWPSLLERGAEAAHLAGEHGRAVALLQQRLADDRGVSGVDLAVLHQRLATYLIAAGRTADALAAHERAVALLPAGAVTPQQAMIVGSHAEALVLTGRFGAGRAEAERALRMAEETGAESEQSQILATLGFALASLEDPSAGIAALQEGRRIAERTGRPHDIGRSIVHLAALMAGPLNRLDEAVATATGGAGRMVELGLERTYGAELHAMAANALFRLGRWQEATERLHTALAAKPTGAQAIELHLARARLLVGRGDFDEAEEELETIEVLSAETTGPRYRVPLLTLRAGLHMWLGRPGEALDSVLSGLEVAGAASDDVWVLAPLVWHGLRAVADSAEAPVGGRTDGARSPEVGAVTDRLLQRMGQLDERAAQASPEVAATVAGYRALCEAEARRARGASDPDLWAAAAGRWTACSHPYPAAYARFHQAEALFAVRAGSAAAAAALRQAHATARRLGARPFLACVEALAQRARVELAGDVALDDGAGAGPVPPVGARVVGPAPGVAAPAADRLPSVLDVLTARELVVLAELADGRSNREIGERLFISEKTVSAHVSHILAKLNLRSRVQASALFHRLHPPRPSA